MRHIVFIGNILSYLLLAISCYPTRDCLSNHRMENYPLDSFLLRTWSSGKKDMIRGKRVSLKGTEKADFFVLIQKDSLLMVTDSPSIFNDSILPGLPDSLDIVRYYSDKYFVDFDKYGTIDTADGWGPPYMAEISNEKDSILLIRDIPNDNALYQIFQATITDTLLNVGAVKVGMNRADLLKAHNIKIPNIPINLISIFYHGGIRKIYSEKQKITPVAAEYIQIHLRNDIVTCIKIGDDSLFFH